MREGAAQTSDGGPQIGFVTGQVDKGDKAVRTTHNISPGLVLGGGSGTGADRARNGLALGIKAHEMHRHG
jgi:hypothetical protein